MKIQRFKQLILSATLFSSPLLVHAAVCGQEAAFDGLSPANDVALQPVPEPENSSRYVLPVVYLPFEGPSPNGTSTVNAELQKIFSANASQVNGPQPPNIALVQHTQQNGQITGNGPAAAQQQHMTRGQRRRAKRGPGVFKRIWGKLTTTGSGTPRGVGEPAPPIPKPPQIVYETNQSRAAGQTMRQNNVPTYSAGYQSGQKAQSQKPGEVEPLIPGARSPQDTPYLPGKHDSGQPAFQVPQNRMAPHDDGFIDPFSAEGITDADDSLLDLDSLLEDPPVIVNVQQSSIEQERAFSDSLVPEQATDSDSSAYSNQPRAETATGPYTGYRLDSDEYLYGDAQSETVMPDESTVAADVKVQELPIPEVVPSRTLSTVQQDTKSLPTVEDRTEVPLLQEPEMQLPIAETVEPTEPQQTRQLESIPLLTEETATPQPAVGTDSAGVETSASTTSSSVSRKPLTSNQQLSALESQARRDQQAYRIMARTGKSGFKGFCPVELRDRRQLIDSRPEYKARFGLQSYSFSSPEAKSAFEANPTRYAPAAGGSDVVLLVNTGEEESGSLDFSLWYRDRLFLFRSRETRAIFSKDPLKFANQY